MVVPHLVPRNVEKVRYSDKCRNAVTQENAAQKQKNPPDDVIKRVF
jgi:hypothetical protein